MTPPVDYEGATTPPIPSSSPGGDLMDISPLPHKQPFHVAINVTLPSPSPGPGADEDEMLAYEEEGGPSPAHSTVSTLGPLHSERLAIPSE